MNTPPSEGQEGHSDAEQKAGNVENQHETDKLLERQAHLPPATLSPLVSLGALYVSFVALVIAFGLFSYNTKHYTSAKIVFFTSIPLIVAVPIAALISWWRFFRKTPAEKTTAKRSPTERFVQSSFGQRLIRLGSSRAYRLANFGVYLDLLAYELVRGYPAHPHQAVALISLYTIVLSSLVALEIVQSSAILLAKNIDELWKHNDRLIDVLKAQIVFDESIRSDLSFLGEEWVNNERNKLRIAAVFDATSATLDAMRERDAATLEAVRATYDLVRAVANIPDPSNIVEASLEKDPPPDNVVQDEGTPDHKIDPKPSDEGK